MGVRMLVPIVLALIGSAVAGPFDDFRSNFEFLDSNIDIPAYRLKDTVQPSFLRVDLDVYLEQARFTGLVQIDVETRENLTQMVLHQKVVSISGVTVLDSAGQVVALANFNSIETDDHFELLKINFADAIPIGNYTLTISYVGQINQNPVDRGFYMGYYYLNNVKHIYATTQFQPFHARKAFPCFDEPQFKSVYVISIVRDSNLSPSYSNMAIASTTTVSAGRIRETFLPTPIISAYLIAFHVSDFVETGLTSTPNKPFQIISRQGVESQHAYAADIGLKITDALDEYLDYYYYEMGQGQPMKNDHIALPDFPSGAMENWGMVNYREAYLLYDERNTNLINKIYIATIMAHELGHKWFGNLVTCFWWSNLWINESFASFFEYFGAHYADPSLELDEQFVVDYVHSALNWDAGAGATPMNWSDVSNFASISSHFSTTSYAKGASVLRMLEHFVGPTTFRNALRIYLKDNEYGIATPTEMYAAFRTAVNAEGSFATLYPGVDIGEVFDSWVQTPGSPVLNVEVNTDTGAIDITQERFQLSGTPHTMRWNVPVSWTHGGAPNFDNTKPQFVLTEETYRATMPAGNNWVLLNIAQSGLYRVNYDTNNWEMIAAQLQSDRNVIHKLNRAQIVNDLLHFIRADVIDIKLAFDVLDFLKLETDYYVWAGALGQFEIFRRRLEHIPEAHDEFVAYLLESMEAVIQELGYEESATDSTSTILNRMQIMNYACNLGHEGCISDSLEKWTQFRNNPNTYLVPVNARRYVYCIGIREGDASDYTFLFSRYNTSENTADMVVMLRALGCTKNQVSLEHYLMQSMHNDRIRIHDRTNAFQYALLGNKENINTVLNFVYNHYQEISDTYGGPARFLIAFNSLATYLTNFQDIVDFQTWLYSNQVDLGTLGAFESGKSIVTASVSNLEWGNKVVVDIYSFLLSRNSAASITAPIVVVLAALIINIFN